MWKRFLAAFAITLAAALVSAFALLLLVDPVGVFPGGLDDDAEEDGFALSDRRFVAPVIVKSEDYDSFILGTSTIHSVDPQWAEEAFGGSFANVTLHGGTPFEMTEMIKLIGQSVPGVRRLILGIDVNRWCKGEGYPRVRADAVFPDWLYDKSRVNDFTALFNLTMIETAYAQLEVELGLKRAVLPPDGYRNDLLESEWSAAKVKEKLHSSKGVAVAALDPYEVPDLTRPGIKARTFPDIRLLRQAVNSLPPTTELILVIMPSHISTLLDDDEDDRYKVEQCKNTIATGVTYPRVSVIDFRIASVWTSNDNNYWDRNHIRVGLAHDLVRRVKEAVERRRDADDGVYRYLAGPTASASR